MTASATCTAWLASSRKRALLAEVGVGTIDQALMAVLAFRHQTLRLLGLSRRVLIVDEVHAFDPYMRTVLTTLLKFQAALGGSAILLSATLPITFRNDLVASYCAGIGISPLYDGTKTYPLLTRCSMSGVDSSPVPVTTESDAHRPPPVDVEMVHSMDEVIEQLRRTVTANRCACYIRNTVGDALQLTT